MDLDLNEEPLESPHGSLWGLGSLINDSETADERIEERIRQLEAVTSRARQRQRWRQGQVTPQIVNNFAETTTVDVHDEDRQLTEEVGIGSQETSVENGKVSRRDSTYLIAKALGMDTDARRARSDRGGFFDCNICLDIARDPILTCCGHLFCWPCFYQLSYVYSNVKECPVCKGEVTDVRITPIYGNGSDNNTCKSKSKESGLKVPQRPHAHRIESMRQQLINQGAFSSPVEENFQQLRSIIGAMGERTQSQDADGARVTSERSNFFSNGYRTSQRWPTTETEGNQRHRSLQVSRLLLQGAASFSSLSSALNSAMDSAERLVEDLETYINSPSRRRSRLGSYIVGRDSLSRSITAVVQPDPQIRDTGAEINSMVPPSATLSGGADVAATGVYMGNQTTDTAVEINSTPPSSLFSRRTNEASRASDADDEVFHASRRRRLS